ncbi:MAG: cryptochrome/photolyase family protein [Gammaproteobacteria bacterium]
MVQTLRFLLGDQLSLNISSLKDIDPAKDIVLMAEVRSETTYVKHHKKKIAFLFSAMRHHAEVLKKRGIKVDYINLDNPDNSQSLRGELVRAVKRHKPQQIVVTEAGEWRLHEDMQEWGKDCGKPVGIRTDDRFFCSKSRFDDWADSQKQLRMEFFYRQMRRQTGYLMEGDQPAGGRWNYDHDNRNALPESVTPPEIREFTPDSITQDVLKLVGKHCHDHFGTLEPFRLAVTRSQALAVLRHFLKECLPHFGDYQDAMAEDERFLYHSLISMHLNCGLLDPAEVCDRVAEEYMAGRVALNNAEGFIRQILGWREYVRGIYFREMPGYAERNYFSAKRKLPGFYWTAKTDMNCLRNAIEQTRDDAYAHHIQRLMVTGNFAMLAGVLPEAICEWYLIVYADAYEWVELPNTLGMSQFADGGLLGSKPYAASGNYINKMSDYCQNCRYKVMVKNGPDACPFNYLYWDFLLRNSDKLRQNARLKFPYKSLEKMSPDKIARIRSDSKRFLESI